MVAAPVAAPSPTVCSTPTVRLHADREQCTCVPTPRPLGPGPVLAKSNLILRTATVVRSRGFLAAGGRVRAACACSRPAVNGVTRPARTKQVRPSPPARVRAARPAPLGGVAPEPEAARGVRMSARGLEPVHMSAVPWAEAPVCLHVATSPCTCLRALDRRRAGAASHRAHSPWEVAAAAWSAPSWG